MLKRWHGVYKFAVQKHVVASFGTQSPEFGNLFVLLAFKFIVAPSITVLGKASFIQSIKGSAGTRREEEHTFRTLVC